MKSTPSNSNALPLVAIVGRPNVGKSTLFNRLTGSRRAIVGDEPGITRDRLYGVVEWRGREFRVVDTGGIIPDDKDLIPREILRQARVALDEASVIVMVVDARTEIAGPDRELARLLQRAGKPLFLAANKVDTEKQAALVGEFHRLGIREVFPVSAENGNGLDDLLDAILEVLPAKSLTTEDTENTEEPAEQVSSATSEKREAKSDEQVANSKQRMADDDEQAAIGDQQTASDERPTIGDRSEIKVAIIGHPNVGKSTLLNRLTGKERAIVSPIPGTTRDAVDEVVEYDGRKVRFVDTAGIRRKGKTNLMAEKLSVVMSRKHLEEADIALFMVDATEGVSALDATIAGYAHESGRSVIIVVNKWDLVASGQKRAISQSKTARIQDAKRPQDRSAYEQRLRYGLKFLSYAPVVFISAETGKGTEKLLPLIEEVAKERRRRVSTSEMNRFLKSIDFDRASVPASKRVKIYYMTQAAVAPPTFVLFTDRPVKLHFSFERFIENQIRRAFGFVGTPIWIKSRASE
ncbi:MAG TPA: ribosome biogenesis GTPase Der [Terriglobales bacterium]|nr:ribosome biogenesis GTPase Der [Terriglobales bacterium]